MTRKVSWLKQIFEWHLKKNIMIMIYNICMTFVVLSKPCKLRLGESFFESLLTFVAVFQLSLIPNGNLAAQEILSGVNQDENTLENFDVKVIQASSPSAVSEEDAVAEINDEGFAMEESLPEITPPSNNTDDEAAGSSQGEHNILRIFVKNSQKN